MLFDTNGPLACAAMIAAAKNIIDAAKYPAMASYTLPIFENCFLYLATLPSTPSRRFQRKNILQLITIPAFVFAIQAIINPIIVMAIESNDIAFGLMFVYMNGIVNT